MGLNIDSTTIQLAQRRLDVISNNISNANSVGFKASSFEQILGATGKVDAASGTSGSVQNFAQGGLTDSTDPLDIAISGKGFFRMMQNGEAVFTRNGQFSVDKQGYIVNSDGDQLTGYGIQSGTLETISKSSLVPLQILSGDTYPPQATENIIMNTALDCRKTIPTVTTFSPTNADSYNDTTTMVVHDAKGTPLTLQAYYIKTAVGWDVKLYKDGSEVTQGSPMKLWFNTDGSLKTVGTPSTTTANGTTTTTYGPDRTDNGGVFTFVTGSQSIKLDLSKSTAYAAPFSAVMTSHDGVELGTISSYEVKDDGKIVASYTNGKQKTLGQVILANFSNPTALTIKDNNQWVATDGSGPAQIFIPGVDGTGVIKGFSSEDSNVDLSSEMIKLIAAQRAFQSSAEVIKREDENLQTLVNIGR